jgi:hypothetical protein
MFTFPPQNWSNLEDVGLWLKFTCLICWTQLSRSSPYENFKNWFKVQTAQFKLRHTCCRQPLSRGPHTWHPMLSPGRVDWPPPTLHSPRRDPIGPIHQLFPFLFPSKNFKSPPVPVPRLSHPQRLSCPACAAQPWGPSSPSTRATPPRRLSGVARNCSRPGPKAKGQKISKKSFQLKGLTKGLDK